MAEENKPAENNSTETKTNDKANETAQAAQAPTAPPAGKKKLIIIAIIIILALAGAGGFFFFKKKSSSHEPEPAAPAESSHSSSSHGGHGGADKSNDETGSAFYDMEEFIVNLTNGNRAAFLKLSITLQVPKKVDPKSISEKIPIIRDNFQIFLRELRPIDLQGSSGAYKIKEELLMRINKILAPIQVEEIHIKDILVTS